MPSAVLLNVVPAFGNLLASLMLISPVPAVLKLRVTGKLGDLNPLPLPLTAYNAMGWLAYGISTSNAYLFPSNFIGFGHSPAYTSFYFIVSFSMRFGCAAAGFVAGIFFTLTAHSAAPRQAQDRIMGIMLLGSVHFITMSIIALFGLTQVAAERMWGTNAIVILMVYYIVPLSSMYDIIRRKNAISIYPPLAFGAIANGGLWTVYGFALKDINLWLPNLFGAVIGIVQLILRGVYGAVPEPLPGVPTPAAPGGASPKAPIKPPVKGGPDGSIEAPEQHPSAKHPAAKEPRRSSILMLLNPYHHASHEDVERGPDLPLSISATASSTSKKPPNVQM